MSFSSDIKEELIHIESNSQDSILAQLCATVLFLGTLDTTPGAETLSILTENVTLARQILPLLKKYLPIQVELQIRKIGVQEKTNQFRILLSDQKDIQTILEATQFFHRGSWLETILQKEEAKRGFLRSAFLCAGSMSNPGKSYHFEIVCRSKADAFLLRECLRAFGVEGKLVNRKNRDILYMKDSNEIIDTLNLMGAFRSSMELENIRIIKEMRNSANRQSNCDSANIKKMVRAAGRQIEDIHYIEEHYGLHRLKPTLEEMAYARLEHPDVSLEELGQYLVPSVGKSGVNHRLRKLSEFAKELRGEGDMDGK